MRIILPIGVILAIGMSFALPYILSPHKEKGAPINIATPDIKENRMLNPQYTSTDEKGNPYAIKADWAKQRTDKVADLFRPQGTMVMTEGQTVQVIAQKGIYDLDKKNLELKQDVTLTSSDGYHVTTEAATFAVDNQSIESTTYVKGKGPMGSLEGSEGFKIQTSPGGGKIITLKGPSCVTITPGYGKKKNHE